MRLTTVTSEGYTDSHSFENVLSGNSTCPALPKQKIDLKRDPSTLDITPLPMFILFLAYTLDERPHSESFTGVAHPPSFYPKLTWRYNGGNDLNRCSPKLQAHPKLIQSSSPSSSQNSSSRPHASLQVNFSKVKDYILEDFLVNLPKIEFFVADDLPASIGFLGLGIMGNPMAQNLIKAGCDVTVWNRTKSKCEPIISLGAKYKSSSEEVAASCDVTFAMLTDPESAHLESITLFFQADAACGKYGAAKGMGLGKGYDLFSLL
ncbi:hypothetical protein MTR67_022862 [Solanum verrucosum]|uniref:6-phosphogluconate dehydrogenase NADP-binding domain-containing protein n=1 Tax=Solanum verrucosum TaxID=315347 RepID=A0AAF0QVN2_SOLVR|nr:hypothetical protein MTR67_022862 [Solanum verrucosum]